MSQPTRLITIDDHDWSSLQQASLAEGHRMVLRLIDDFRRGSNRFNASGEALCAHFSGQMVIAACGLNREQDARYPRAGRIRRLYVLPQFRGRGLARSLIAALLLQSLEHFDAWTVNVGSTTAAGFYEHLGFTPVVHPNITHIKKLE